MPRHAIVYMGVDPGLANTGVVICRLGKSHKLEIIHDEVIHTDSKDKLSNRFQKIRDKLGYLIEKFGVNRVICEAYEVRGWGDHKGNRGSTSMSKLVNEISDEVYTRKLLFVLSSPSNKRAVTIDKLPEDAQFAIKAVAKTYREHVMDAYIHVWQRIIKKGF